MTIQRFGRSMRMAVHLVAAAIFIMICPVVAFQAGDWHWPYVVQSVDLAPDPVPRGGTLSLIVVRTYLDNCDLSFARRIESVSQPSETPTVLAEEHITTPWRFNNRAQTLNIVIPHDFPCGSAQIRTSPHSSLQSVPGVVLAAAAAGRGNAVRGRLRAGAVRSCPEGAFTAGHLWMAAVAGLLVGIVVIAVLRDAGWLRDPPP